MEEESSPKNDNQQLEKEEEQEEEQVTAAEVVTENVPVEKMETDEVEDSTDKKDESIEVEKIVEATESQTEQEAVEAGIETSENLVPLAIVKIEEPDEDENNRIRFEQLINIKNEPDDEIEEQLPIDREDDNDADVEQDSGMSDELQRERTPEPFVEDLERTVLGDALDALMMHWCQLLTNVSVRPPVPPPSTLDHVKEVAEVCSKHFRDACVDVTNEFTRLAVQEELEEHESNYFTEEKDLDEAIRRQKRLIKQAKKKLQRRLTEFRTEYPEAGTFFTT